MGTEFMERVDAVYTGPETAVVRDLRLNLKRLLSEGALSPDEALLTLLATARSVGSPELETLAREGLAGTDVGPDLVEEGAHSAAIMGMLNTYYRFKHMLGKDEDYRAAGLRMMALSKPQMGKERFEMLAFAVSVLNGCETCVRSHEQVLRDAGISADKVHDLARIAAVVRGFSALAA